MALCNLPLFQLLEELHVHSFGRVHQTLRVTAAMEAGAANYVWSVDEIVGLLH